MASPFHFSGRPTFVQTPMHSLTSTKLPKAPQHNPYDKFTQPEFDAWIGGITGALKRALGQEDEVVAPPQSTSPQLDLSHSSDEEEVERLVGFDGHSSDEDVEDSFLHMRRVSKGKARDPREGPGFGNGGKDEPIIIGSDSEEEDEEESGERERSGDELSEEWDETSQSGDEDSGSEAVWNEAESSLRPRIRDAQAAVVSKEQVYEDEEFEEDEESGEDGEDDYGVAQASSPILDISDDDGENTNLSSPQIHTLEDEEFIEELSGEEDATSPFYAHDNIGPRHLLRHKFHSEPESVAQEVLEDEQESDHDQPLDYATSCPPQYAQTENHVEIRDPWSGPRTYAEDYYSGGDIIGNPQDLTADRLGENDEIPDRLLEQRDTHDIYEAIQKGVMDKEAQPSENDTSSILCDTVLNPQRAEHVETRDSWPGPTTEVEGPHFEGSIAGTLESLPSETLGENAVTPNLAPRKLTGNDGSAEQHLEAQDVIDIDADDVDRLQPVSEDTSFPPGALEAAKPASELSLEIPDRWDGPKTYAEDYYSGGDVFPLNDGTSNPHCIGDNDERTGSPLAFLPDGENEYTEEGQNERQQQPLNTDAVATSIDLACESPQLDYTVELPEPRNAPIDIASTNEISSQELITNHPGSGVDRETHIVVDSEDETDSKIEEPTTNLQPKVFNESLEYNQEQADTSMDVDHLPSSLDPPDLGHQQSDGRDLLHDDIPAGQPDDLLDWFSYPIPSGAEATASESLHGETLASVPVDQGMVQLDEGSNFLQELNTQSRLLESTEVVEETPGATSIVAIETTTSNQNLSTSPMRLISRGLAESSHNVPLVEQVDHDQIFDIPVLPEIEEAQEADCKVVVDAAQASNMDLDIPPKDIQDASTQATLVESIEDHEEDSATLVEIVSKDRGLEVDDIVSTPSESPLESKVDTTPTCASDADALIVNDLRGTSAVPDIHPLPVDPLQNSVNPTPCATSNLTLIESHLDPTLHSTPVPPLAESVDEGKETESGPSKIGSIGAAGDAVTPFEQPKIRLPSNFQGLPSAAILSPYLNSWPSTFSGQMIMRKTTDPVLLADPYPASLSTPDDGHPADKLDTSTDESFFDESSQLSSSSSSSLYQETEGNRAIINGRTQSSITNSTKSSAEGTVQQNRERKDDLQESTEVDADGDLDPDYAITVPTKHPSSPRTSSTPNISKPELSVHTGLDTTNGLAVTALSEASGAGHDENITGQESSPLSSPVVEHNNGISTTIVKSPLPEDNLPSILIIKKVYPADEQTPARARSGKPLKRKRSTSITAQLPRSGSSAKLEKGQAPSRLPTKSRGSNTKVNRKSSNINKGKGEGGGGPLVSRGSFDTQSISSRSSSDASSARRMLTGSRNTSRASSIASNAPSDNSIGAVQPSPTLGKGSSSRQQLPPPPPPPLLHRHHHNRPSTQPSRLAASVRSAPTRSADAASFSSPVSKQITSQRHPYNSSSPVTRSNCRYHKISIPLDDESDDEGSGDEDVKLVYFLVPGCSLGNAELNRDEKIVDHGDATVADSQLMTPDLDAYAFNAPLLSVLRLLVGIDMLREGEIYYLPLPGSNWVPRKARDSTISKPHYGHGVGEYSGTTYQSPRRNSSMSSISIPASITSTSAPATSSISQRPLKPSSAVSQASTELSDIEDSPQSKRLKYASTENGQPTQPTSIFPRFDISPMKSRPLEDGTTELHDDLGSEALRSNKGPQQGLKRSRTTDLLQEHEGEKLKKQKSESQSA